MKKAHSSLQAKYVQGRRIKDSHEAYLEGMLGLDGKGQPSTTSGRGQQETFTVPEKLKK